MSNKTTYQTFKELDEAIDNFVLELCKEIKIPEFLEWLTNKIESHNKSN